MTSQDDYAALREGAIIGAIAERRQIAVSGPDRASFLQGLLTNDIPALDELVLAAARGGVSRPALRPPVDLRQHDRFTQRDRGVDTWVSCG